VGQSSGSVVQARKIVQVDFSWKRRNSAASPGTWLRTHSRRCACHPARTLSCCTTWPRWGLFHSHEPVHGSPGCHIAKNLATCVFMSLCMPPHTHPLPLRRAALLRVISLTRTCPWQSRLHIPPPSGAPRLALLCLSAVLPGRAFMPLSATGLGFGQVETTPEIYFHLN